jgi:hypothetical protein
MDRTTTTFLQGSVSGLFGVGLVYTLLPVGFFSTHDLLFRALVTVCVAVLVALVVAPLFKRRISK